MTDYFAIVAGVGPLIFDGAQTVPWGGSTYRRAALVTNWVPQDDEDVARKYENDRSKQVAIFAGDVGPTAVAGAFDNLLPITAGVPKGFAAPCDGYLSSLSLRYDITVSTAPVNFFFETKVNGVGAMKLSLATGVANDTRTYDTQDLGSNAFNAGDEITIHLNGDAGGGITYVNVVGMVRIFYND